MTEAAPFFASQKPYWASRMLGTDYQEYTHHSGCFGLAAISADGTEVDFLAVNATVPRIGQCRAMFKEAQDRFDRITVWSIWEPVLAQALIRWGFAPCSKVDGQALVEGMEWKRQIVNNPPAFSCSETPK